MVSTANNTSSTSHDAKRGTKRQPELTDFFSIKAKKEFRAQDATRPWMEPLPTGGKSRHRSDHRGAASQVHGDGVPSPLDTGEQVPPLREQVRTDTAEQVEEPRNRESRTSSDESSADGRPVNQTANAQQENTGRDTSQSLPPEPQATSQPRRIHHEMVDSTKALEETSHRAFHPNRKLRIHHEMVNSKKALEETSRRAFHLNRMLRKMDAKDMRPKTIVNPQAGVPTPQQTGVRPETTSRGPGIPGPNAPATHSVPPIPANSPAASAQSPSHEQPNVSAFPSYHANGFPQPQQPTGFTQQPSQHTNRFASGQAPFQQANGFASGRAPFDATYGQPAAQHATGFAFNPTSPQHAFDQAPTQQQNGFAFNQAPTQQQNGFAFNQVPTQQQNGFAFTHPTPSQHTNGYAYPQTPTQYANGFAY
ncbi:hypothetical protein BV25DRAFT_1921946, partial [Artomyces pyxidatus]